MKRLRNSFKALLGFTLAEVVIVMLVVAVIVAATIGVTKHKLDNITTYTYYSAYSTLRVATSQMLSDYDPNNEIFQAKIETPDLLAKVGTFFANNFGILAANAVSGIGGSSHIPACGLVQGGDDPTSCRQHGGVWCRVGIMDSCTTAARCCDGCAGFQPTCGTCDTSTYTWKTKTCPAGTHLDTSSCTCVNDVASEPQCNIVCRAGQTLDKVNCKCITNGGDGASKPECTGGKVWNGVACVCPAGKEEVNGQCVSPCTGGKVRNSSGLCVCPSGTETVNGKCVAPCTGGKVRNSSGVCVCPDGKEDVNGTCMSPCPNGKVRNSSGACVCPSGKEEYNGRCVDPCTGGKVRNPLGGCVCPSGTTEILGRCLAPAVSQPTNPTCSGGKVWNGSACVCPSGTEDVFGTCKPKCSGGKVRNSSGICVCPSGKIEQDGICVAESISIHCFGGREWNGSECVCPEGKEWTGLYCRDIPRVYDCTGTAPCGKQCDTSTGNWINIPGFSRECDPEQNKVWSESQCACVPSSRTIAPKGQNYCEYMVGLLNTKSNAPECTGNAISTNALDFSDKLPDITLRNGMRLFNVRQNPQMIPALANNVEGGKVTLNGVEVDTNRWGYTVYVDIDGEKGNSEKWVDVFPFYVTLSGMVIPAYDEDNPGVYGGDNRNFLQVSIEDEVIDNGRRKTKWLAKSVSYKEAACGSGYIGANTPYCKNGNAVPIKNECNLDSSLCRLKYIKPIKFLF